MLVKRPKTASRKWLKKGALVLFGIEAVVFAVSFGLWYKVNSNRDTRKYLKDNYPNVLEGYYRAGELIDRSSKIRDIDSAYWNANKLQYPGIERKPQEVLTKNQQFANVLRSASESNKPLYRLTKEEIEKTVEK